jgi:hypothetical protein
VEHLNDAVQLLENSRFLLGDLKEHLSIRPGMLAEAHINAQQTIDILMEWAERFPVPADADDIQENLIRILTITTALEQSGIRNRSFTNIKEYAEARTAHMKLVLALKKVAMDHEVGPS